MNGLGVGGANSNNIFLYFYKEMLERVLSYLEQELNFRELCTNFVLPRDTLMPFYLYPPALSLSPTHTHANTNTHTNCDIITLFFLVKHARIIIIYF
jgi:hypothetical protein